MTKRNNQKNAILENRFIAQVLREESVDIEKDILKNMSSFSSPTKAGRSFSVNETTLSYKQRAVHRFIDMRTRQTKKGKIKKKSYPIYNRPIYGHLNNIAHRISFGFTEAVKEEMKTLEHKHPKQ